MCSQREQIVLQEQLLQLNFLFKSSIISIQLARDIENLSLIKTASPAESS